MEPVPDDDPRPDTTEALGALDKATGAALLWDPHAEEALRKALASLEATGDPIAQARGWNRLGAYFTHRAKSMPAALSYWQAFEFATRASMRESENEALVGLCYALSELHEGHGQLAAMAMLQRRDALGVLPTVADVLATRALAPLAMRRLLASVATDAKCMRQIGRSLRKARRSFPDFETRFITGEVRFDAPDQIFELVRTPQYDLRHREVGAAGVAQFYAKRLRRRLITGVLPLVLVAAVLADGVLDPSRAVVWAALGPILAIYLAWWGVAIRAARIWVRRSRDEVEMYRRISRIEQSDSTHARAYGILQEFADCRRPFALVLRGFDSEAAEQVTPGKSTRLGAKSKAEIISSALMQGSSATVAAAGYLEPTQWVITTIAQPSEVEKFLAEQASRHIPMITISNPAALATRASHYLPRLELGNDDWKVAVRLLVSAAQFIVVDCPALTPGVAEELELILNRGRQDDTVIVYPSSSQKSGQLPESWINDIRDLFGRVIESAELLAGDLAQLPAFEGLLEREKHGELPDLAHVSAQSAVAVSRFEGWRWASGRVAAISGPGLRSILKYQVLCEAEAIGMAEDVAPERSEGPARQAQRAEAGRDALVAGRDIHMHHHHYREAGGSRWASGKVWGGVPARNPGFTGREGLLDAVRGALAGGDRAVVQALRGMGGVGKTQIAIEYVHRYAPEYDIVWWINSERAELIAGQFAALATELGPVGDDASSDRVSREVLAALHGRERWLLVFDNVEHPQDVAPWLPGGSGHVVITSRAHGWDDLAVQVSVDVFTRAEAVAILQSRVPCLPENDAGLVAAALGNLPLAVAQAAGYLADTGMATQEYLRLLKSRPSELLDLGKPWQYPRSLAAATRLTFEKMMAENPVAAVVAGICAVLKPEPVPQMWFAEAADRLPGLLGERAGDPIAWGQVVSQLRASGLIRVDPIGLVMHRLTQAVIRDLLPVDQLAGTRNLASEILNGQELIAGHEHHQDRQRRELDQRDLVRRRILLSSWQCDNVNCPWDFLPLEPLLTSGADEARCPSCQQALASLDPYRRLYEAIVVDPVSAAAIMRFPMVPGIPVVIGRNPRILAVHSEMDPMISQEIMRQVSRLHLLMRVEEVSDLDWRAAVIDLESTNGTKVERWAGATFLQPQVVPIDKETFLSAGDRLILGGSVQVCLRVRASRRRDRP